MERSNTIDSEIIKLAASGDNPAFDQIYRAYRDKIYYYVIKLGAKPQDAEDIVSETFLEAMKHMQELKNESALSSWLHTIAKNKFYALGRKESRHQRVELLSDDEEDGLNDGLELAEQHSAELNDDLIMLPEDYAESEETKEILADMINSLNEVQREAIYLFYHRDKSLEQISQLTGASVNTVKSRIHQAKNHLRKKISELQKSGVVLGAAPVSAMFRAVDGRVKVRTNLTAPKVLGGFSAKIIAAACAVVVGGTSIMLMKMKKHDALEDNLTTMDTRPDSSYTDTDSSRPENKKQLANERHEDESSRSERDISAAEGTAEESSDRPRDSAADSAVSRERNDDPAAPDIIRDNDGSNTSVNGEIRSNAQPQNTADTKSDTANGNITDTKNTTDKNDNSPAPETVDKPSDDRTASDDSSAAKDSEEKNDEPDTPKTVIMGSGDHTFEAVPGDVVKFDVGYMNDKGFTGLQFDFNVPEGLEYVGFIPNEDAIRNTLGFNEYGCGYLDHLSERAEIFDRQYDITFIGFKSNLFEGEVLLDSEVNIGSILMRLKDGANEENVQPGEINLLANNAESNVYSDFDLKLDPVRKAEQDEIDSAIYNFESD